ncbi:MAG TPA: protein kinase [Blastocatellia bacterium]|nr:protein kinase [Blastocatellia bacterium]
MDPERWQQLDKLLQSALDLQPDQRAAFLDQACLGDSDLRVEMESLLASYERAENFIETPVFEGITQYASNSQHATETGQFIGPYKILSLLGAGGMGEVYLAEDTRLQRKIAIKLLLSATLIDARAKKRFINEAKAVAKLDHPNICAIHEVGVEDGRDYIVMQYVEGETLASRIANKPLELNETIDVVKQVAEALAEAHAHNLLHRDIKPQNVIITPRGQVKVLDFGLAKEISTTSSFEGEKRTQSLVTEPGIIVGTAPYMSPEQAKGKSLDARSDLFSLGLVFYECLSGGPAFCGATPMEIFEQIIKHDLPPPSQLNPLVPSKIDQLVLKAIAKDPGLRYQTATEFIDDLNAASAGLDSRYDLFSRLMGSGKRMALTLSATSRRHRILISCLLFIIAAALFSRFVIWPPSPRPLDPSPKAMRLYEQGTNAVRDGTYFKASKVLQLAIGVDEGYALAHARLAEAWAELDYSDKANSEIALAWSFLPYRSQLSTLDTLYLEAITKTVTRNYANAIESYHKIAQQVPEAEKPYAHLDLGRAYEKNEEIEKAIAEYEEAVRLDNQYPAALLRLGILYGRQRDRKTALEIFDNADRFYQATDNIEGRIEVLYQRGAFLFGIGEAIPAGGQLQKALAIIRTTTDNRYQEIKTLLQLGRISLFQGNTAQAKDLSKEAIDQAQRYHLENLATEGLIDLGITFYNRREYDEAENYLKKALEFAQRYNGQRNQALARLALGKLYIQREVNFDEALDNIERAQDFFQSGGYEKEVADASLQRGLAKFHKKDYEGALKEFYEQLRLAESTGDRAKVAASQELIGKVHSDQEAYKEAYNHFNAAYEIHQSQDKLLNVGYSLLDRADMLWHLGRYDEALRDLAQVPGIANRLDSNYKEVLTARTHLVRAQLALSRLRFAEAIKETRKCMKLAGARMGRTAAESTYTLALAQSLSGAKQAGKMTAEKAREMAEKNADSKLLSNALLVLSIASLERGDAQSALKSALQAEGRFAQADQLESDWRALLILGRASLLASNISMARDYLIRAETLFSGLQQRWGADDFKGYLERPDIQLCQKQLQAALEKVK